MSELSFHSSFMEKTSLGIVFDRYLEHGAIIKGFKNDTLKNYREAFRLIQRETSAKTISDLTVDSLERMFMKAQTERQWSPYTFFSYHKNIKAFFNWAVIRGYLRENPMKHVDRPRLPKSIPKALTEEQAVKVIDAAYHLKWYIKAESLRNRAIVSTFIFAGLRRKELCDLKRQDVDLERRKIFIYDAKWGKDRVVPINSRLHFFLSEYAEKRDKKYRDNVHFFVSLRGHQPIKEYALRRIFKRIKTATDIHVTPHMLRHTFGTLAYRGSKDILGVSASLGHSNLKTTQIYVQASADDMKETVEAHPLNY